MTSQEFRDTLHRLGITQAELGRLAGVPKSTLRDWAARGTPGGAVDALLTVLTLYPPALETLREAAYRAATPTCG